MANRVRDDAKELFWRKAIRRFEGAGETVRRFCRQEGLAESSFYAWRRTIAERDARAPNSERKTSRGERKSGKAQGTKDDRKATTNEKCGRKRKRKAAAAKTIRQSRSKREQTTQSFVPIVLDRESITRAEIVLELSGGRRLRLDANTSVERLAAIVRAIESEVSR